MTTGRINQVSHRFERIIIHSHSQSDQQHPAFFKTCARRPPAAARNRSQSQLFDKLPRCAFCRAPDAVCQIPKGTCTAPGQKMRKFEAKSQKEYGTTYKASS